MGKATSVELGMSIDRYVVERELGRGATAVVYLARDRDGGRMVALKVMRDELIGTISTERFFREIRRTAELSHAHIVPLLASGEYEGKPFCVLPYMDGGTLRQRLQREKQLPIADAVTIATQVARALAFAHSHNLIHRDVKPENILFTGGQATLADFGIARALEHSLTESTTSTGVVRGTPAYMSPEQAVGETNLDGRSDIYSLGCVLYEMVAGIQAFVGPTPQAVLAQRISHPPRPISVYRPLVPMELQSVIEKALATSAADRYRSADELASALEGVNLEGMTASAARAVPVSGPGRRKWSVAGLAVAGVLVAAIVTNLLSKTRSDPSEIPDGDPRRIAVLYLEDQTPETIGQHVADGLTEELIDLLVDARSLHVVSQNGVRQFRHTSLPPDSIARRLNVGTIVAGTISRSRDTVRVSVRLIDEKGRLLSTHVVESSAADVFALQRKLADQVAVTLRQRLGDIVALREHRAATQSTKAWELVQMASSETRQGVNEGLLRGDGTAAATHYRLADSLLAHASTLDESWALPWIRRGRLALTQLGSAGWAPQAADSAAYATAPPPVRRRMWAARAMDLANAAIKRDAQSAEGFALRGAAAASFAVVDPVSSDSLSRLAENDIRAAIAIKPSLVVAHYTLAQLAQRAGRFSEAAAEAQFAYDLDDFFEVTGVASTGFLSALRAERFGEAKRWCQIGLAHHAGDPRFTECELTLLGWTGRDRQAIDSAWTVLSKIERGDSSGMLRLTFGYRRLMIAAIAARAGLGDSARAIVNRLHSAGGRDGQEHSSPIEESYVELLLGNRDSAITILTPAARSPAARAVLANHPWFRPLQSDPRFSSLVAPSR